ncbi:MAG: hypothetical protein HQM09_04005 [Candidatus Riflebacteria bacterium]|nr:hypothetical protein [Candidatus Riflebacteria bacterium]
MSDKVTLIEAAKEAGTTRDKAKYWLELLKCDLPMEKHKILVPVETVVTLKAMRIAIDSGLTPSAAAERIKLQNMPATPASTIERRSVSSTPFDAITQMMARLDILEKAVMRWVDDFEDQLHGETG